MNAYKIITEHSGSVFKMFVQIPEEKTPKKETKYKNVQRSSISKLRLITVYGANALKILKCIKLINLNMVANTILMTQGLFEEEM